MATNIGNLPVDNICYFGYELIEEGEMEDTAHDLPSLRPLLPLGKGHTLPQKPNLVLNELSLLNVMFLFLEELLQEMRVDNQQEALVERVEYEVSGLRVGLKGSF